MPAKDVLTEYVQLGCGAGLWGMYGSCVRHVANACRRCVCLYMAACSRTMHVVGCVQRMSAAGVWGVCVHKVFNLT